MGWGVNTVSDLQLGNSAMYQSPFLSRTLANICEVVGFMWFQDIQWDKLLRGLGGKKQSLLSLVWLWSSLVILADLSKKHPKYTSSSCLALGWGVLGRGHRGYFLFLRFLLTWMEYHWVPQRAEISICCERMGRTHSKYKSRLVNQRSRSHFCCVCHHSRSKPSFSLWVNLYNSITIKNVDDYLGKCA